MKSLVLLDLFGSESVFVTAECFLWLFAGGRSMYMHDWRQLLLI